MGESEFESGHMEAFRRYFNQEMTPGEQQRFEKRLLSDALFSDAYEGYVLMMTDEVDFPREMGQMLSEREKARKKVLPLWRYAAAAVVLFGLIGFGYWNYRYSDQPVSAGSERISRAQREPALTDHAQNPKQDTSLAAATSVIPSSQAGARDRLAVKIEKPALKPSPSYPLLPKEDRIAHLDHVESKTVIPDEVVVTGDSSEYSKPARMPAPGLTTKHFDSLAPSGLAVRGKNFYLKRLAGSGDTRIAIRGTSSVSLGATIDSASRVVRGRVVDKNGQPIPGAVALQGYRKTAVADESGYFKINAAKEDSLQLFMIGYLNKKVAANTEDLGSIQLSEDEKALSEVVVVGYGVPKKSRIENRAAEPLGGWKDYRKYIRRNSDIPGLTGNVAISFRISPDGSLSEFQSNADQWVVNQAILRIKKGPKWKPALKSGIAVSEQVIVNFGKDN